MKKGLLLTLGFFVTCLTLCGCSSSEPPLARTEKIENIQAVFLNRPNDYTVLIQKDKQLIPRTLSTIHFHNHGEVKLLMDAPSKGAMWAELRFYGEGKRTTKMEIDIHIHSKNDIQGGQWRERHGKGAEQVGGVNKIE
jgi:hypothetical protein